MDPMMFSMWADAAAARRPRRRKVLIGSVLFLLLSVTAGHAQSDNEFRRVDLIRVNDVVYSSKTGMLYATTGRYRIEGIHAIDPKTATVTSMVTVEAELESLTLSGDKLFVYSFDSRKLYGFDLPQLTVSVEIELGDENRPLHPCRLGAAVLVPPGDPEALLVSLCESGNTRGVTVLYRNGVRQPRVLEGDSYLEVFQPTENPDEVWARSESELGRVGILEDGLEVRSVRSIPAPYTTYLHVDSYYSQLQIAEDRVYSSLGAVYDMSLKQIGLYEDEFGALYHSLHLDTQRRTVLRTSLGTVSGLRIYDMDRYVAIGKMDELQDFPISDSVPCGGTCIAIRVSVDEIYIGDISSIPATPATLPTPVSSPEGIITLQIPSSAGVLDRHRNLIHVTVPGTTAIGNQLVSLDAKTLQVKEARATGSAPDVVALRSGDDVVYVGVRSERAVQSFDLAGTAVSETVRLGADVADPTLASPYPAKSIQPIADGEFAVVRQIPHQEQDIVLYRDGIPAPDRIIPDLSHTDFRFIATDTDSIFIYNEGLHAGMLRKIKVDSDGLEFGEVRRDFGGDRVVYASGLFYSSYGQVVRFDGQGLQGVFPVLDPTAKSFAVDEDRRVIYTFWQRWPPGLGIYGQKRLVSLLMSSAENFLPLGGLDLLFPGDFASFPLNLFAVDGDHVVIQWPNELVVIPTRLFQRFPRNPLTHHDVAPGIRQWRGGFADMVYDAPHRRLAVSLNTYEPEIGNRVAYLDPDTGVWSLTDATGSDTGALAFSADGSEMYLELAGFGVVRRYSYPELRVLGDIRLPYLRVAVGGMEAVPGTPSSMAIRQYESETYLYDSGVQRASGAGGYFSGTFGRDASEFFAINSNAGSALRRYSVDEDGFQLLSESPWVASGREVGTHFHYAEATFEAGLLYASTGQVIEPQRARMLGRYPISDAIDGRYMGVVVDTAADRLYSLETNFDSGDLRVFDKHSFQLLGRLVVPNAGGGFRKLLKIHGNRLAFLTTLGFLGVIDIEAIPIQPEPPPSLFPDIPSRPGVHELRLSSTDIAYDPKRGLIYSSVENAGAVIGDSIAAVRPETGEVEHLIPIDGSPGMIVLTQDGTRAYVAIRTPPDGALQRVQEIDLVRKTAGPIIDFEVDVGDHLPPSSVYTMVPVPSRPRAVLASVNWGRGLRILEDGKEEPVATIGDDGYPGYSWIAFGDESTLFGFEPFQPATLTKLRRSASGFEVIEKLTTFLGGRASLQNNRFFFSGGEIVDADTMQLAGAIPGAKGSPLPDLDNGSVYFLEIRHDSDRNAHAYLNCFDSDTFSLQSTRLIPWVGVDFGIGIGRFLQWGPERFAFVTHQTVREQEYRLLLVDLGEQPVVGAPKVDSSGVADAASFRSDWLAPGSIVSILGSRLSQFARGAEFVPLWTKLWGTRVFLDGEPIPLYSVSPTQVNAQIPYDVAVGHHDLRVALEDSLGLPLSIRVQETAPGLFAWPDGTAIAAHVDGSPDAGLAVEPELQTMVLDYLMQRVGEGAVRDRAATAADLNGSENPISAGSVAVLYVNGLGRMSNEPLPGHTFTPIPIQSSRPLATVLERIGGLTSEILSNKPLPGRTPNVSSTASLSRPLAPVRVSIGGLASEILFIGGVPGLVGLGQLNVRVPNLKPGLHPVVLTVGQQQSTPVGLFVGP